jgi:outer membrane protein insertion porin family
MGINDMTKKVLKVFAIILIAFAGIVQLNAEEDEFEGKTIKDVRLTGVKWTKEYVVLRELESQIGEPYSSKTVNQDIERLEHLGIFSEINIYPKRQDCDVILEVVVKEIFPFFPSPTFRITDEDGLLVGVAVNYVNGLHKAVSGSVNLLFGGATNIDVNLKDPWLLGNRFGYEANFIHRDRRNAIFDYDEIANEVYLRLSSYVGYHGRVGTRIGLQSIRSDSTGRTLSPSNEDHVPSLGVYVGWDSRDRWGNPKQGWWNEIAIGKFGIFGGDSDFWRANIDLRKYHRFTDHFLFVFTTLLTVTSGTVGQDIAEWQQFGVGGTNSVRGYDLGSRIGKNQNINTVELRYNFLEPRGVRVWKLNTLLGLQVAGFFDLGHAWSTNNEFTFDNYISGYGLGLRLIIPKVAMIRFDFGLGESGKGIRFHVGGFEKAVKQRDRVR